MAVARGRVRPAASPRGLELVWGRWSPRARTAATVAPALGAIGVLFGGALTGVISRSLDPTFAGGGRGPSAAAWRALASDPAFLDSVRFTAQTTALATVVSAALALALALALRSTGSVQRLLVALPVPVPHLLVAVVAVLWLAPGGLVDRALGAAPDLVRDPSGIGIVLVYVYKETPFLVILMLAAMGRGLAAREEAAAAVGASPLQRLRWVVWPVIRAPLLVGCLVVAAFVIGAFEVPLVLGPNYPPTIATFALEATQLDPRRGYATAAAALLVATAASIALALLTVRVARASRD